MYILYILYATYILCGPVSLVNRNANHLSHHPQTNNLQHSLTVEPSDLKRGDEAMQDAIMSAPFPPSLEEAVATMLATPTFEERYVAVRSSGTDEDSSSHSFAGEI